MVTATPSRTPPVPNLTYRYSPAGSNLRKKVVPSITSSKLKKPTPPRTSLTCTPRSCFGTVSTLKRSIPSSFSDILNLLLNNLRSQKLCVLCINVADTALTGTIADSQVTVQNNVANLSFLVLRTDKIRNNEVLATTNHKLHKVGIGKYHFVIV